MFNISKAKFITSVASEDKINQFDLTEIAIAGRSNVGKSSLINFLCSNFKLAKVSATCGKTKLINYFSINDELFYLVDLPGYGYAEVSKDEKLKWAKLIEKYLTTSKNLKHVFALVDIRHKPNQNDINLINYLHYYSIDFTIIATKADKLSRQQIEKQKQVIANTLNVGRDNIIITSTLKKIGKEEIFKRIEEVITSENICD